MGLQCDTTNNNKLHLKSLFNQSSYPVLPYVYQEILVVLVHVGGWKNLVWNSQGLNQKSKTNLHFCHTRLVAVAVTMQYSIVVTIVTWISKEMDSYNRVLLVTSVQRSALKMDQKTNQKTSMCLHDFTFCTYASASRKDVDAMHVWWNL